MKKKSYKRPIALLIAVIGAYHVVLFALHPRLPPVAKSEVVWGNLSDSSPQQGAIEGVAAKLCPAAPVSDIPGSDSVATPTVERVRFEYRPEANDFRNTGDSARIIMSNGSNLTIGKDAYPLVAIEFEKGNTAKQMAFHLIHRLKNGRTAVVSVPLQIAEKGNPAIEALWRYLPQHPGEHNSLYDLHVDINTLLPQDRTYYRYDTGRSCGKQFVWLGLKSPVQISTAQAAKLNRVLSAQPVGKSF